MLLKGYRLEKWFGDRLLFMLDELRVMSGQKIGIVGVNGVGKTTLLKVLAGEVEPDGGVVTTHTCIMWIRQDGLGCDGSLSSGERRKREIGHAFHSDAAIVFADEPTSHLDIDGIEWLETQLVHYKGAVLLVSHDRELLEKVCTHILEIENGCVTLYKASYVEYLKQKQGKMDRAQFEYDHYLQQKKKLENAAAKSRLRSEQMDRPPNRMSSSESKLLKMKAASKQGSLERKGKTIETRIEKLEKKEKPTELTKVRFDLSHFQKIPSKIAIRVENSIPTIQGKALLDPVNVSIPTGSKVALIGGNGTGKSTLLNMIFHQEQGVSHSPAAKVGFYRQDRIDLDQNACILEVVTATSPYTDVFIRTILARLLFRERDLTKKISNLSGGEKARVALARIFLSSANVLLLDEPTNFLDMFTKVELAEVLLSYPGTILFASHDRHFIRKVANQIIIIGQGKLHYFRGTYEEYLENSEDKSGVDVVGNRLRLENEKIAIVGRLSALSSDSLEYKILDQRFQQIIQELRCE